MSYEGLVVQKILEETPEDTRHYLSSFPTQILLRVKQVKDGSGRTEYVGYAPCEALLSDAKWMIKKQVYDAGGFMTDVVFANGEIKFDKIFDSGASEYASYTYSTT